MSVKEKVVARVLSKSLLDLDWYLQTIYKSSPIPPSNPQIDDASSCVTDLVDLLCVNPNE
jgi:hypothetical protein